MAWSLLLSRVTKSHGRLRSRFHFSGLYPARHSQTKEPAWAFNSVSDCYQSFRTSHAQTRNQSTVSGTHFSFHRLLLGLVFLNEKHVVTLTLLFSSHSAIRSQALLVCVSAKTKFSAIKLCKEPWSSLRGVHRRCGHLLLFQQYYDRTPSDCGAHLGPHRRQSLNSCRFGKLGR